MDSPSQEERPEPFPTLSPIVSSAEASRIDTNIEKSTIPQPNTSTDNRQPTANNDPSSSTTAASTRVRRSRGSSLLHSFANSNLPLGMWQATGELSSKAPTIPEIRNGSFSARGWTHEGQCETRNQLPHEIHSRRMRRTSSASAGTGRSRSTKGTIAERAEKFVTAPVVTEEPERPSTSFEGEELGERERTDERNEKQGSIPKLPASVPHSKHEQKMAPLTISTSLTTPVTSKAPDETGTYPNGYRFPKKHTWTQSMAIGAKAFWKFFLTIPGFLITIYGLNVVAWGAMIFFVLIPGATPAMCHPSCDDDYSSRKIWIEIDSQILNALFCVTGFGLLPWRLRDFYFLTRWRLFGVHDAHRRLAGIYRGWYRLPGSQDLPEDMGPPPVPGKKQKKKKGSHIPDTDEEAPPPYTTDELSALETNPAVPLPPSSMPNPPLTGIRAAPTKSWNLDIVIWMYILNSAFQVCLASFMWARNRFTRPSWATGFFITIGCVTGIIAGIVVFTEGSKVKKAEGIPVEDYDVLESVDDYQKRKAKEDEKDRKKAEKVEKKEARAEKVKS